MTGTIDILIGTHAILEENVVFKNLGLVVTDEQHRFGVRQREKIIAKGKAVNTIVMSATPIPRTLGLILYGDLDISIIDELPKGRKEIKTTYTDYNNEEKIYKFTEQELQKGRQVYVVCPLVEQSETSDLRSTEEVLENYTNRFKNYNVVCIHGKMKEKEKQELQQLLNEKPMSESEIINEKLERLIRFSRENVETREELEKKINMEMSDFTEATKQKFYNFVDKDGAFSKNPRNVDSVIEIQNIECCKLF